MLGPSDLTLAILAGGKGARLGGVAKGLLLNDGLPFIHRLLALQQLCAESMIVSADPAYDRFAVRRIEDLDPGHGAPGGVVTALLSARSPWVLIVACDMPFVTLDSARTVIGAAGAHDVTCYVRDRQPEPMLAVYRASLGRAWQGRLRENPSLRALIADSSVETLDPTDLQVLDSVNTPAQLALVKS